MEVTVADQQHAKYLEQQLPGACLLLYAWSASCNVVSEVTNVAVLLGQVALSFQIATKRFIAGICKRACQLRPVQSNRQKHWQSCHCWHLAVNATSGSRVICQNNARQGGQREGVPVSGVNTRSPCSPSLARRCSSTRIPDIASHIESLRSPRRAHLDAVCDCVPGGSGRAAEGGAAAQSTRHHLQLHRLRYGPSAAPRRPRLPVCQVSFSAR